MISGNSLYVTLKKRAPWLPGFTLQPKSDTGLASGVSRLCFLLSCPLVPSGFLSSVWRPQSGGRSSPTHMHFDLFKFSNLDIKTQNWDFPFSSPSPAHQAAVVSHGGLAPARDWMLPKRCWRPLLTNPSQTVPILSPSVNTSLPLLPGP
jgi:hypothetical protein